MLDHTLYYDHIFATIPDQRTVFTTLLYGFDGEDFDDIHLANSRERLWFIQAVSAMLEAAATEFSEEGLATVAELRARLDDYAAQVRARRASACECDAYHSGGHQGTDDHCGWGAHVNDSQCMCISACVPMLV